MSLNHGGMNSDRGKRQQDSGLPFRSSRETFTGNQLPYKDMDVNAGKRKSLEDKSRLSKFGRSTAPTSPGRSS